MRAFYVYKTYVKTFSRFSALMRAAVSNVMDAKVRVYAKFRFALSLNFLVGLEGSGCEGTELCMFRFAALLRF